MNVQPVLKFLPNLAPLFYAKIRIKSETFENIPTAKLIRKHFDDTNNKFRSEYAPHVVYGTLSVRKFMISADFDLAHIVFTDSVMKQYADRLATNVTDAKKYLTTVCKVKLETDEFRNQLRPEMDKFIEKVNKHYWKGDFFFEGTKKAMMDPNFTGFTGHVCYRCHSQANVARTIRDVNWVCNVCGTSNDLKALAKGIIDVHDTPIQGPDRELILRIRKELDHGSQ